MSSGRAGNAGGFSDFFRVFFGQDADPSGPATTAGAGAGTRTGAMGFDDILAGMGIDGRTAAPTARQGNRARPRTVHEAAAEITLEEAYHGTTRLIDVDGKRLEITIPPGADTGTRIKLTGRGPGGGDIVVVVRQLPDARFARRGADLDRELRSPWKKRCSARRSGSRPSRAASCSPSRPGPNPAGPSA